jgi:hypothetical protein
VSQSVGWMGVPLCLNMVAVDAARFAQRWSELLEVLSSDRHAARRSCRGPADWLKGRRMCSAGVPTSAGLLELASPGTRSCFPLRTLRRGASITVAGIMVPLRWGSGSRLHDRPGFGRIGRSLANQRPPFYRPTDRLLSSPPRAQPPIGLRAALLHRRLASGWAGRMIHFHIPLSLVSCIVFPVQLYSTEGDSQLRLWRGLGPWPFLGRPRLRSSTPRPWL